MFINRKSHLLMAYYQQMPPFAGGTAMRGGATMPQLAKLWHARGKNQSPPVISHCEVLTTVGDSPNTPELRYVVVAGSSVSNRSGLLFRLLGELAMGLSAALQVLVKGPACVLLSSPGFWPCVLISVACRLRGITYVLDVRDLYPEVYAHSGLLSDRSLVYRLLLSLTRWWYRGAASIAVATVGLQKIVQPLSRDRSGQGPVVEVVYNGFPASLKQIRPNKHARFTVVFHGVLGVFQDVETLCLLAQRLHQHNIDVLTIGYGKKEHLLRECIAPNLRFLGQMPHAQTMEAVAKCHIGLCLRLDDGISRDAFPVKVWEYLGLSIPSLVTPPCEAGTFLTKHGCGIQFAAGDIDAIESVIVSLRENEAQLASMASSCTRVVSAYTRKQMGEKLANLVIRSLENSQTS
jgi:glycosyltransferase involved in cell wall biosynthesis